MLVKSLVAVSKKSCRQWGKIRAAFLRCDSERSAGSYDPRKRVGTTPWIGVILTMEIDFKISGGGDKTINEVIEVIILVLDMTIRKSR